MQAPRSKEIVWFFDLDDTLHHATPHIFPHMNRAMTQYVMQHLALDEAAANQLRERYWRRYGATLLGLMRHHATDPRHFLAETHRFPDLTSMVLREAQLRAALRQLPGEKVLFSNAPRAYVLAVLLVLGIRDLFSAIYSIESLRYRPKPSIQAMQRIFARHPARVQIMVEDNLPNLRTARRCGLATVWMRPTEQSAFKPTLRTYRGRPGYVDATVESVHQLLAVSSTLI